MNLLAMVVMMSEAVYVVLRERKSLLL